MKTRIGKRRTGRLFKHGAGYAVAWTVNGKRMFQSLRDADGNPITVKKEAETARAELMAPYRAGDEKAVLESIVGKLASATAAVARLEDERTPALSVADAWEAYLAAPNKPDSGPRTLAGYESQWNRFADWMKTTHPNTPAMRDVTRELAGEYAADLSQHFGASTYNKHIALLSLVFRTLADHQNARYTADPFGKVTRKRIAANSRRELTVEELTRVCATATGELRTLFAIGVYTGLRLGDVATLRWQEIDLIRGVIIRIPLKTARRNPKPVTIPVHQTLAAVFAAVPEKQRRGYVLPEIATQYREDNAALSNRIQEHFTANGVQTVKEGTGFVTVLDEKGNPVLDEDGNPKEQHSGTRAVVEVGFHSLRHTFVSLCRAAGAPLSVVEAIVGHASPAMTRHYTHVGEDAARASVILMPSVLGGGAGDIPALPEADKAKPASLPDWASEAAKRALLALDKGDTANVRKELEALTVKV